MPLLFCRFAYCDDCCDVCVLERGNATHAVRIPTSLTRGGQPLSNSNHIEAGKVDRHLRLRLPQPAQPLDNAPLHPGNVGLGAIHHLSHLGLGKLFEVAQGDDGTLLFVKGLQHLGQGESLGGHVRVMRGQLVAQEHRLIVVVLTG